MPTLTRRPSATPPPTAPPPAGVVYLPRVVTGNAKRSPHCLGVGGLDEWAVEQAAGERATHFSVDARRQPPRPAALELLTVAEADARYGTSLTGVTVRDEVLAADRCIWWAVYEGLFDCECDPQPPALFAGLEMALFPADGFVLFEAFSAPTAPPPTVPPLPADSPTPRTGPPTATFGAGAGR
jgi:hypothetical protein